MSQSDRSITFQIPDNADISESEARMCLATKLYERGKLSLGQAAELAGYSKEEFMGLLSEYDTDLISHSPDDLEEDINNASDHVKSQIE